MDKNEVISSLKSSYTEKVAELEAAQAEVGEAIKSLEEARKAGDAGLVSDASEKVEKASEPLKARIAEVDAVREQMDWFKGYPSAEDLTKNSDEKNKEAMKALFDEIKEGGAKGSSRKFTVGEHVANGLQWRGISSINDLMEVGGTKFTFELEKGAARDEDSHTKSNKGVVKDIKSIYSNYGEVFLDASAAPVSGFVGFQCGLVEDNSITCLLDPPEEDFEECIQQLTLNGNRIRFTREASRVNNAASVLETIYNPYPDMEQDGTKPESTFSLEDVTVRDVTIANFITASDRVLEDCGYIAQHIDHVLISNVNREKRRQLINGSGTNGQMLGILNQPNLLSRTHQDVGDGGAPTDNLYDTFRRGLTDLWYQNASLENICIIMNPRDGEIIDLTKDDLGRYLFNDSDCFNRNLRCLKIRYATDVPEGTAIMGNFSGNWQFYLRKALNVKVGLTGNQFIENAQTILAEMRGLTLVRCPRKILKVDGLA